MEEAKIQGGIRELFYVLSGIPTPSIEVNDKVISQSIPEYMIEPFNDLVLLVNKYLHEPRCLPLIEKYLNNLNQIIKNCSSLEELVICLRQEYEMFIDIDRALGIVTSAINPLKELKNRQNEFKVHSVYAHFLQQEVRRKKKGVEMWVNYGEIVASTDHSALILENPFDEFAHSFWKDKYRMNNSDAPPSESSAIEECGKIVNLIRLILGREVVDDTNESIQSDKTEGPIYSKAELLPFRYGTENVLERRFQLLNIFVSELGPRINKELEVMYNYLLMRDLTFFYELLRSYSNELSLPLNSFDDEIEGNESLCRSITSFLSEDYKNLLRVSLSGASFCDYVLKLLQSQKKPANNLHITVSEALGFSLKSTHLLYFFSQRLFCEIEMLGRFLFTLNYLLYHLDRKKKYNFTRFLSLIFRKAQSKEIREIRLGEEQPFDGARMVYPKTKYTVDLNEMVSHVEREVKCLLENFFLMNPDVFYSWSLLIDVAMEYSHIEYPDIVDVTDYDKRTKAAIAGFCESIKSNYGESEFYEFLRSLDADNLL